MVAQIASKFHTEMEYKLLIKTVALIVACIIFDSTCSHEKSPYVVEADVILTIKSHSSLTIDRKLDQLKYFGRIFKDSCCISKRTVQ